MTDLPRRPQQHDLKAASTRAFVGALPDDWESSRHGEDIEYGIDLDIEIFSDGRTTGLMFHSQVKGTESLGGASPKVTVKRSTWNYWRQIPSPTLVVLWERDSGRLWSRWVHHHDTYGNDPDSMTMTIGLGREWDDQSADEIEAEVRAWHAWDRAADLLPISVTVTSTDDSIAGVPCHRIASDVRRLVLQVPQVLKLSANPVGDLHFKVNTTAEETVVWVAGGPSATVHHRDHLIAPEGDEETAHFVETLAASVLLSVGFLVSRFGTVGPAARVVAAALEHGAVGDPQIAGDTIAVLMDAGRLEEGLSALHEYLHAGSPEVAEGALTATLWASGRLDDSEKTLIANQLERWADEHAAAGDHAQMAGTLTYNAGRFLGQSDLDRVIRLHELAAERQPAYRGRGYWNRELGGALFLSGDAAAASQAYQTAVALGDDRSRPLLGDALLECGRYREALELFEETAASEVDRPEWALKRYLLEHFMERIGIDTQDRVRTVASDAAETTDDPDELLAILVDHDFLCGHAHWKLAQQAQQAGQRSFEHFLACALADPDHPEAWLHAVMSAGREEPNALVDVAMTARRMAGHEILDMLLTTGDPDDARLARTLDQVFAELPDDPRAPFELRRVGSEAGDVISRTIDLDADAGSLE